MEPNVFTADDQRTELIKKGNVAGWYESYATFPALSESKSSSKWDFLSGVSQTSENIYTKQRILQTAQLIKKVAAKDAKTLDFGVGYGDIASFFKEEGLNYHGIDISTSFINTLRSKYGSVATMKFDVMNISDVAPASYDLLLALEVLEHIEPKNIFALISSFRNILKPNGVIIVSVPFKEDLSACSSYCSVCSHIENPNGHVRSYSLELVRQELEYCGFEIIDVDFVKYGVTLKSKLRYFWKIVRGKDQKMNIIVSARKTAD
jgi:2-polyprenyl-3-methyl-5-hydroxy-6-metoxy-1,4-benzoquinol methylase